MVVFELPAVCSMAGAITSVMPTRPKVTLKELAVPVNPGDNRTVSFTNKQSAYTQTHRNSHPEHAWFRGLNIAGRRVFNDYHLIVDGTALDPAMAQVVAHPDALVRAYPNGVMKTLRLFDNRDLVEVTLTGASGKVNLRLSGDQVNPEGSENQAAKLALDILPYTTKTFAASPGDSLIVEARTDGVHVRLISSTGSTKENVLLPLSQARRRQQAKLDATFGGTQFAKPTPLESHPVMKRVASMRDHSL
jgi:hypothetical protein